MNDLTVGWVRVRREVGTAVAGTVRGWGRMGREGGVHACSHRSTGTGAVVADKYPIRRTDGVAVEVVVAVAVAAQDLEFCHVQYQTHTVQFSYTPPWSSSSTIP